MSVPLVSVPTLAHLPGSTVLQSFVTSACPSMLDWPARMKTFSGPVELAGVAAASARTAKEKAERIMVWHCKGYC